MTSRIIHSHAFGVLDIDTSNSRRGGEDDGAEPSRELIARARVGWERFARSFEEPSDG
ncbi:hypothetical protein ACFWBC_07150 [Streptomyces sp. NPDC059985]|uniref:hypothetical protein n=1 Tax=Streptomyces sp. NPDC059985 TaxID=3347025 RepID=UPI0036BED2EB